MRIIDFLIRVWFTLSVGWVFALMLHETGWWAFFGCGVLGWVVVDLWHQGIMREMKK